MSPARALRLPPLRYRSARRTDVETLAELGLRAYRVSSLEQRREFYTDHPRFGLRDVRVAELDGQIVASLVIYSFTTYVRGAAVPLAGIGSLAVSPEHRRRGVAESLMRSALREARQQGRALVALYPFRASYYRRLGFGTIEMVQELAVSPANLPASGEVRFTRRLMLPDRPAVQALYDRVAAEGHFALGRSTEWWNRRLWGYPGDWIVYEGRRRGQIEGYLYYEADSSHGPFKLAVTLSEFVAATPQAHRGLVGYLHALSDQVTEIHYAAPGDNGFLALLRTAQNLRPGAEIGLFHDTGNVAQGAMLRVTDPKLALEALPAPATAGRGELTLEVEDEVLPVNARGYRVSVKDGRFKVEPGAARSTTRARLPRLAVPADALGPLIAGTLSPVRAAELGLVESVRGAAELAETWFRTRPAFLYQLNAF